jgi:hypothetical protein
VLVVQHIGHRHMHFVPTIVPRLVAAEQQDRGTTRIEA